MAPPIPQPKNSNPTGWIRKSPRTLKREAFERRKAAYEAQLEYEATLKMNPARKKLNAKPGLKKVVVSTKKKVVNAASATKKTTKIVNAASGTKKTTKRKPQSRMATSRKRAKKVTTVNMDDSDNDDDVDYGNVDGSIVGGDDDVDDGSNVDGNDGKVDDDDADDSYDDEGEDVDTSPSESGDEFPNADIEEAVVDNDQDSVTSNQQRLEGDMHGRDGDRREVSTSTGHTASAVQPIAVVRTPNALALSLREPDGMIHIRGMSRSESLKNRQKFVTQRVTTFVKSELFRKIKFINSDASFQKAFKLVMDHEDVSPRHRVNFQMTYETVFNEALNSKRSSCEQAGGKIVRKTIAKFEESGEDFFTIDELTKLRRANTDRERKAFFWFFGTFLECVCGRRNWGKLVKCSDLVSQAKDKDGGPNRVVTKSDEAFALLIFENYVDKWKMQKAVPVDDVNANNAGADEREATIQKQPRQTGTYTGQKSGHCKYGGWSHDGMVRFNELYKLVADDRACLQAEAMEKELREFCRSEYGGDLGGNMQREQGNNNAGSAVMDVSFVEAAWDLDD
jgi:hypothetical protein